MNYGDTVDSPAVKEYCPASLGSLTAFMKLLGVPAALRPNPFEHPRCD
jgi:hypothetical protein